MLATTKIGCFLFVFGLVIVAPARRRETTLQPSIGKMLIPLSLLWHKNSRRDVGFHHQCVCISFGRLYIFRHGQESCAPQSNKPEMSRNELRSPKLTANGCVFLKSLTPFHVISGIPKPVGLSKTELARQDREPRSAGLLGSLVSVLGPANRTEFEQFVFQNFHFAGAPAKRLICSHYVVS